MSRNAAPKHHQTGDGDADQVRQKKQKRTLRNLIGETGHCSATKHCHHFRAKREANAADAEGWNQGNSNRDPSNRVR